MKKIILTLAIVIASTTVFSQVTFKPGARAGVNFANISQTNGDTKTDFYIGGLFEMKFADIYALQPELVYTRQGAKSPVSGGQDIEIQYVGIAVANKFSPFKSLGLHFIVGPEIDIKVGDNVDYTDTAPLDISIFGGIGYELPIGLTIEARYKQGVIDIDDGYTIIASSSDFEDDNNLNGVIQFGLSYKFDFSKK